MTKDEKIRRLGKQCRIAIDMLRLYCPFKEEFIDEITEGLREASKIIKEHYKEENKMNDQERTLLYTSLACLEREIQKQHKGIAGTTDPMLREYMQDIVDGCEFAKKKICELFGK